MTDISTELRHTVSASPPFCYGSSVYEINLKNIYFMTILTAIQSICSPEKCSFMSADPL
jgi:hypothetical protein